MGHDILLSKQARSHLTSNSPYLHLSISESGKAKQGRKLLPSIFFLSPLLSFMLRGHFRYSRSTKRKLTRMGKAGK